MESTSRRAVWLPLICAHFVFAHIHLDAPEQHQVAYGEPSFVRHAVESIPEHDVPELFGQFSVPPSFGETFLPLRSAVESVPTISLRTAADLQESSSPSRAFVRDSVEALPEENGENGENGDNNQNNVDEESAESNQLTDKLSQEETGMFQEPDSWAVSDRYAAFIIPNEANDNVADFLPQPYRSDSPYQEIVDPSELPHVKDGIQEVELVRDQLGDESVTQGTAAAANEVGAQYEALAQIKALNSNKNFNASPHVLCYITNWVFYRKGDGQFVPEHIDKRLCTTLVYSFASLDPDHLTIREFDPWVDIENQFYNRSVRTGVPVLIAMGGWTDSSGDKYSRLASDEIRRRVFASNVVGFIKRYGFSGLHLDWNYPKCWQSNCAKGPASDKPNLTKLLSEIRTEFRRVDKNLKLGVAISGYKEIITEAYEFPALSKIVDYLTVMTYDYHGAWERQTGHVSPLYGRKGDKYPQYNTDYTIQLLLKLGAQKDRIIMGIPFYGQTFTLKQASEQLVGEGTSAEGPGDAGEYTKQPGMLAYYEICQRIRKQKWLTGRDPQRKAGPFAMLGNQWVGYEDPASAEAKARYAVNAGLGGVAAWTVDLDDFQNRCCQEAFPLLKAINRALGRLNTAPPTQVNCQRPPPPVTPTPAVMTTVSNDESASQGGGHDHSSTWPTWGTSTTTSRPSSTTQRTSTIWWTPAPSTTTRRPTVPTTTTKRSTHGSRPTSPSSQKPVTIPVPAVVRPVIQVSDCQAGQFYVNPYNCNAYYQCVSEGELVQQYCPGGLHWNAQLKNCDWPAAAMCTERKRKPVKKPTASSRPATARPAAPTTKHGTTATSWSSTNRPTRPIASSRPSVPTRPIASTRPTGSSSNSTNKKPTRKPIHDRVPAGGRCNTGEYYTHRNCDQYYICVNGVLVPHSCGGNLHWDAIRQTCNWPQNVQCVTARGFARITASNGNIEDPCQGKELVSYPGDCSKYLFCLWNRLQAADCAPGLHFNPDTGLCDWPLLAKCEPEETSTWPVVSENEITKPPLVKPAPPTKPLATTERPTYPTERPALAPLSGYYKVVCYFTNWAWYRKGLGRYTPDDINTDLCTHIVYGFAVLDYSELIIRTHDSWADIDNNFYTRVSGLRSKGVKVSLALGGWNDSQGDKYSRLVRNPAARARFVRHAVEFLEKYGFQGLDLDWEYPVCWQTECNKGMADEKQSFTALVRELHEAFAPRGLLLSSAVSPSKKIVDAGYDVAELSKYFDWIAVMTYDFHGQWDKKTGHVAPLYYHPDDDYDYFNANYSLHYWIEKGAPARKIVMGMPLYGQSFTLENARDNGLNAKAPGPGEAGEFTRAAGFLAYYEICDRVKHRGWEVVHDELGRMGPFARKGTQWVSYDDPAMIRKKCQLIRSNGLGGGMVWALDLDDFRNRCGEGVHPLLRQIHDVLKDPPTSHESTPGPTPIEPELVEEHTSSAPEVETGSSGAGATEESENTVDPNEDVEEIEVAEAGLPLKEDFKVVCYFTNWAWYRQSGGKYLPEDIDPKLCTHIVYGFAVLNRETLTIQPHDTWADLDNEFYKRVTAFRAKGIKVTVAIGGWNDSAGDKYARLVLNVSARARFIRHVIEFIEKYGFEGLDLDWEYPVCWQVDCKKGSPDEKAAFRDFVRELSQAFKPRNLLLSAAVSPNKKVIDAGYDVPQLSKYFDWIAVMTYDYHGQWDKKTGHIAPMYDHPAGTATFNANFSINYWLEKGADREKLVMGMPMYGQSFTLAQASDHGLNAPTYGGGEAGEATRARGFLSYYEICTYIRKRKWNVVRDPKGRMGPYAYLRDQWVSFDDAPMIRHKSEYIRAMGLGGAMIWALDLDDFRNICDCESYPLLKTINRVLRNYPGPHPKCILEPSDKTMIGEYEVAAMTTPKPRPSSNASQVLKPSSTSAPKPSKKKECFGDTYAPHERDCNKYYICQYGELVEQRCPSGLYWNGNYCDWPQAGKCTIRDHLTTKRPKPTPTNNPTSTTAVPDKLDKKPSRKPTPAVPLFNRNEQYKVVCYFTNWAWYRPSQGRYVPEDIDENLCTHIVYGFAVLNSNTLTIQSHDSWADVDNRFYERVVAYKRKGIRVTVALGGWNDSLGSKYARLVLDPQARHRFIANVLTFLEKYGFEGLDLDWEYPVCWQVDCTKGSSAEKTGFSMFVRELSEAFRPRSLLLSAAVSPSKKVIDAGYDVPSLSRYFDWIAVMTYDFHGHWDKKTGHVAPLYFVEGDAIAYFNANYSIHYWLEQGAPPQKLVMGMPLYGQSFTLANGKEHGLNDKSKGPGRAGTYTRARGFLAYYEICEQVGSGNWSVVRDPQGRMGPYAYNGNQWMSYDDVSEIRRKSKYIRSLRLGGGMVWALDLDDFRGRCGCGRHPLLRTLNQELRGIPGQRATDCT